MKREGLKTEPSHIPKLNERIVLPDDIVGVVNEKIGLAIDTRVRPNSKQKCASVHDLWRRGQSERRPALVGCDDGGFYLERSLKSGIRLRLYWWQQEDGIIAFSVRIDESQNSGCVSYEIIQEGNPNAVDLLSLLRNHINSL